MTSIASSSASTDSRGVRRGPPIAAIGSQNAPAPSPSSARPPERMSRLATARASTAGGRSGRFRTFPDSAHPLGSGGDEGQQRPRVQEPRLVRVVLEGDQVEARPVGELRQGDDAVGVAGGRGDEHAEAQWVPAIAHGPHSSASLASSTLLTPSGEPPAQNGRRPRRRRPVPPLLSNARRELPMERGGDVPQRPRQLAPGAGPRPHPPAHGALEPARHQRDEQRQEEHDDAQDHDEENGHGSGVPRPGGRQTASAPPATGSAGNARAAAVRSRLRDVCDVNAARVGPGRRRPTLGPGRTRTEGTT